VFWGDYDAAVGPEVGLADLFGAGRAPTSRRFQEVGIAQAPVPSSRAVCGVGRGVDVEFDLQLVLNFHRSARNAEGGDPEIPLL
jgi:hypothetical protein